MRQELSAGRMITLVSALGTAQSVAVVMQVDAIGSGVRGSVFGGGPTATIVLGLLSAVFLTVAITVTSVVVTGTTEVVMTGQVRDIALRRLLGASAAQEGRRVRSAVLRRARAGMLVGVLVGYVVSVAVVLARLSPTAGLDVPARVFLPSPLLLVALAAQWLATRACVARGTRGVRDVAPVEALRRSASADTAVPATLGATSYAAGTALWGGLALLGAALALSVRTPLAMLPAVAGGVLSFVGVVSYGPRLVPPLIGLIGRLLPRALAVSVARRSLSRHPHRTSRAVLGVAATITLVTTFAVGISSFERAVQQHYEHSAFQGLASDVLAAVVSVVLVLTLFLGATAAVALGNAVSLSAWLRRRDTALLRVLGQSARQTRATVLAQSLLLALTAAVVGLVLGTLYGWIGAQSVFGVEARGHVVVPVLPVALLVGVVVAVGLVTLSASFRPIRASLEQAPIRAFVEA